MSDFIDLLVRIAHIICNDAIKMLNLKSKLNFVYSETGLMLYINRFPVCSLRS